MNNITIRMPKKMLAKWLKALRTGGYRQAEGTLYDAQTGGFCCLGVLQHCVLRGEVEVDGDGDYASFPSMEWLAAQGIEFTKETGTADYEPWLPTLGLSASDANDAKGKTFKQIADAIEECAEGY